MKSPAPSRCSRSTTLPAIRDADLVANFTGRTATVTMGRGTVDLPSGRKLSVSNGVFEVPDTAPKPPPGRLKMKVDGPADAAIELAGMEPLRGAAGAAARSRDDARPGHRARSPWRGR